MRAVVRSESGESTVQLVVLVPVVLLLVMLVVQSAVYFHAANVATAAASRGAAAGATLHATSGAASEEARRVAGENGAALVGLQASGGAESVRVTVRVRVARVVPFFPDSVSRSALEPKERFVPEVRR